MRNHLRLPSPAMVVAIIALIIALGGSAYAAVTINGKNIKNGTITGKKLKNKTITTGKLSNSTVAALKGQKGDKGDKGATGATGPGGGTGPAGANGTAVAYARVAADGTVDASRSLNITQANMQHTGPKFYCFVNLPFTPKNVQATLEAPINDNDIIYASIPDTTHCPSGAVTVEAEQVGGTNQNSTFYVLFN